MSTYTTTLRTNCLNFWEVLAQAIALISPTMTAALIVPLMYGTAGNASWLAYLFGAVMLLFVALNLNQFAKRSSTTGSMYHYTHKGLGTVPSTIAGWSLMFAYLFIGTAGMTGFVIFATQLLAMVHIVVPTIALFLVCGGLCTYLAYKDIQLSTIMMLVLEGLSVGLIMLLIGFVLSSHGINFVDTSQISLKGLSPSALGMGVIVAIFSLVGFECATAFGTEAHSPLKTIPRAVVASLIITGLFFVLVTYVMVFDLRNFSTTLDKLDSPLITLATIHHVAFLAAPLAMGAMVSFYSLAQSCLNAGSRIAFAMAKRGAVPDALGVPHPKNGTPHIAAFIYGAFLIAIPLAFLSGKIFGPMALLDVFNDAGTFGAFGFLGAYFFISAAAPAYLKKIGELRWTDVMISALAMIFLLLPAIGTVYPIPAWPLNIFPYVYLGYLFVGWVISKNLLERSSATTLEDAEGIAA